MLAIAWGSKTSVFTGDVFKRNSKIQNIYSIKYTKIITLNISKPTGIWCYMNTAYKSKKYTNVQCCVLAPYSFLGLSSSQITSLTQVSIYHAKVLYSVTTVASVTTPRAARWKYLNLWSASSFRLSPTCANACPIAFTFGSFIPALFKTMASFAKFLFISKARYFMLHIMIKSMSSLVFLSLVC